MITSEMIPHHHYMAPLAREDTSASSVFCSPTVKQAGQVHLSVVDCLYIFGNTALRLSSRHASSSFNIRLYEFGSAHFRRHRSGLVLSVDLGTVAGT